MKISTIILYSISMISFYIGSGFFFADGRIVLGTVNILNGTLLLIAILMNFKSKTKPEPESEENNEA